MKKYILLFTVFFTFSTAFSQDLQDTVVFDLPQQTQGSGYVEFPVYFLSDDVINAVDFSLQYNTVDLAYDSIIKLASYLNITTNEVHGADTTVYFTSYSLQTITNDTPLVLIRFTPATQICSEDIISASAYLNGNAVSLKIVDCSTVGIANVNNDKTITSIYPNPVANNTILEFSLSAKSMVSISVHDIAGKAVYGLAPEEYSAGLHKLNLNLSALENGMYVVRINSENETKSTRMSVIR